MTLNRRYKRSIKGNLSFYVSSTVLTITSLLLFFMLNIAGNAILEFYETFSAVKKVEEANFTTYLPIPGQEIDAMEDKYGIVLETERFVNIDTDDTTARVFARTKKINLYDVTVGEDVSEDDEIIISEGYAVNRNVHIGDKIKVGEKEYRITGFFQRPDYLYMLENESDSYKNITSFFLAYLSDHEFETLGRANTRYLVRYNGSDDTEFRKEVNHAYFMRSYLADTENPRIKMVNWQAEIFVVMSYLILCIMPLIAVALISIVISRKVKSEQKMIGTLAALGYKKGTLMRHYAGFAGIPGIMGGLFAVIIAEIFAQPFGELCLADYEPMRIACHLEPAAAVCGMVVPTVMYIVAALLSVNRLLNKDTVLLLSGNADGGRNNLKKMLAGRRVSFKIKYAVRSLIGNPARTFVVLLGIFLGSYIVLLGFAFFDAMEHTISNGLDDLGSYQYQYVLNQLVTDNVYGGEPVLMAQMEEEGGRAISVIGADAGNRYLNLNEEGGGRADLDSGCYVTSLAAMLSDIEKGDVLTLYNPLNLEENAITVVGIIRNDMQKAVFMNREAAAELLGVESGACNALMSADELDIPESMIVQTMKKSDSGDSIRTMIDQMGVMLYLIIILGVIICVASIYVAVNMLVTENRVNISMLKVLGYTDAGINKIVLRVNHILLPIGILLCIPAVYASCNAFFGWGADFVGVLIKSDISLGSYIAAVMFTGVSYFGSLMLVRRKVKRVDMVESLKDNRE